MPNRMRRTISAVTAPPRATADASCGQVVIVLPISGSDRRAPADNFSASTMAAISAIRAGGVSVRTSSARTGPASPWKGGCAGSRSYCSTSIMPRSLVSMTTGTRRRLASSRSRTFAHRSSHSSTSKSSRTASPKNAASDSSRMPSGKISTSRYGSISNSCRAASTALFTPRSHTRARKRFRLDRPRVSKSARRNRPPIPSSASVTAAANPTDRPTTPTVFVASNACSSAVILYRFRTERRKRKSSGGSRRTSAPDYG